MQYLWSAIKGSAIKQSTIKQGTPVVNIQKIKRNISIPLKKTIKPQKKKSIEYKAEERKW